MCSRVGVIRLCGNTFCVAAATEEFWEETEVDENGVEGETRVVDAPTESASAKPTSTKSAKLPAMKKSERGAAESKPAAAETKPKKKSKKAAGTRDIMCVLPRAGKSIVVGFFLPGHLS